jgi:hypothetical protein
MILQIASRDFLNTIVLCVIIFKMQMHGISSVYEARETDITLVYALGPATS